MQKEESQKKSCFGIKNFHKMLDVQDPSVRLFIPGEVTVYGL